MKDLLETGEGVLAICGDASGEGVKTGEKDDRVNTERGLRRGGGVSIPTFRRRNRQGRRGQEGEKM